MTRSSRTSEVPFAASRTNTSKVTRYGWTLAVSLLLAATGCHHKTTPLQGSGIDSTAPGLPAPTATITADPLAIDLGQSVVLNWRTTDTTSVSIDGIGQVSVNGTQTVSPASSTNFHLVAKGDGGTTEANVRVTVRVPVAPSTPNDTGVADNGAGLGAGSDAEFHSNVQDLFFDYDSYDLRPDAAVSIASAARYLNSHPGIRVLVGGYCDDRGSADYNLTLGQNRADAARTALINAGVSPSRVRSISYGKERQFCTEENETCWQENRRAQFTIDR